MARFRAAGGSVRLNWETRDLQGGVRVLRLTWIEQGAPPITKPQRLGTGSQLIDHSIADMEVVREFKSEGLYARLRCRSSPPALLIRNPTDRAPLAEGR